MPTTLLSRTEVSPGVHRFEAQFDNGFYANMHVLRLPDGGLFVYSPIFAGDALFDQLDALGPVRVLFAPNHYHHLSLPKYVARYPTALACAGTGALPRLRRKGHALLKDAADAPLPSGARWLDPEGVANGERWIALDGPDGPTWLVSDAFMNVTRPVRGFTGVLMKLWNVVPGLQVSRTWRWVGLRAPSVYVSWLLKALERERPVRLLVGHGDPLEGLDLPTRLGALATVRLT